MVSTAQEIAGLVRKDVQDLVAARLKPTQGDIRCIAHGHLVRLAIWNLRQSWDSSTSTSEKLQLVAQAVERLRGWTQVSKHIREDLTEAPLFQDRATRERALAYQPGDWDEIPF